jgi:glutamine phosphoribosylpyrophosphate amidotransferase
VKAIGFEDGEKSLCMACLTGKYPTKKGNELVQQAMEKEKKENKRAYE